MVQRHLRFSKLLAVIMTTTLFACGDNADSASTASKASGESSTTNPNEPSSATTTTASSGSSSVGTVVNGTLVLSPNVEVGPFWVEEQLNRSLVTPDPNTQAVQQGVALTLNIFVHEANGLTSYPLAGCTVDLWQANALGIYSDESAESTSGQKWLRGYQVTDNSGMVSFSTIVPGWYSGRTPHIHFRLRKTAGNSTFNWTTQAFISDSLTKVVYTQSPYSSHNNQDTFTTNDRLYQSECVEGSTSYLCGDLLLLQATQVNNGYQGELHIYVDSIING